METETKCVNNAFYDDLHKEWYDRHDHPVALLRSENLLRNPWIQSVIQGNFEQPVRILDIGCGAGLLTNYLATFGHAVTGVDLSQSSLAVAREKDLTKNVAYRCANGYELPFEVEEFDVVCSMDVLEHVENPEKIICEASRVLKPGGLFFFHTFNRTFLSWLLVIKGVEWCVRNTPKDMHLQEWFITPEELSGFCEQEGLAVEKILGVRPDFKKWPFWKMLATRKVPWNFRFCFTRSLRSGYSGYAKKLK